MSNSLPQQPRLGVKNIMSSNNNNQLLRQTHQNGNHGSNQKTEVKPANDVINGQSNLKDKVSIQPNIPQRSEGLGNHTTSSIQNGQDKVGKSASFAKDRLKVDTKNNMRGAHYLDQGRGEYQNLNLNSSFMRQQDPVSAQTPGIQQMKFQGQRVTEYDNDYLDPEEEASIKKMTDLAQQNDGSQSKIKPLSAYPGDRSNRRTEILKNQSRGKMENQSQIPNELLEADNVANGQGDNNDYAEGDNKTDCISLDDITNDDNDVDDIVVTHGDGEDSPQHSLDDVDVQIDKKSPFVAQKTMLDPNKKLSNINEYAGENELEPTAKKEEALHAEDSNDEQEEKKEKKRGNGLEDVTPEELARLKQILGPSFTLDVPKIEGPGDFLPARLSDRDDQFSMKNRLKKLQDREALRIKANEEDYIKTTARDKMNKNGATEENLNETEEQRIERLLQDEIEQGFDPSELKDSIDGWEIYKRKKVQQNLIKRYCATLDQDYTRYKITVCCHLNHIFDLYLHQRRPFMRTLAAHMEKQQRTLMNRAYHHRQYGSSDPWGKSYAMNQSMQCLNNGICSQCPEDHEMDKQEKSREYNTKYGIMNPNLSNQIIAQPNYYRYLSDGIQYYKEEKDHPNSVFKDESACSSRPIKRLYINFDKDIAARMFGYRVRFVEDQMTSYMGQGIPSSAADQSHKPIENKTKELIANLQSKYMRMEDYSTKKMIVKMLDSDDEEDQKEIEKNQRLIRLNQRNGPNYGNTNPKIRKTNRTLHWVFDNESEPSSPQKPGGQSPLKRKLYHTKRFVSNTLRDSQNMAFRRTNVPGPNSSFGSVDPNNSNRISSFDQFQQNGQPNMGLGISQKTKEYINQMQRTNMHAANTASSNIYQNIRSQLNNHVQINQQNQPQFQYSNSEGFPFKMENEPQVQALKGTNPLLSSSVKQNSSQIFQNPQQLTREKIELQRAFLIDQLSQYPQAYNAYLMMSGIQANNQNQQTGQNQMEPFVQNIALLNQNQNQNQSQNTAGSQARTNQTLMPQNSSNNTITQPFSVDYGTNSTFQSVEGAEMQQTNYAQPLLRTPPKMFGQKQDSNRMPQTSMSSQYGVGVNGQVQMPFTEFSPNKQPNSMMNSYNHSHSNSGIGSPVKTQMKRNSSKLQFASTATNQNQGWVPNSQFMQPLQGNGINGQQLLGQNPQNHHNYQGSDSQFVKTHGNKKFSNPQNEHTKPKHISRTEKKVNPNYHYSNFASQGNLDHITTHTHLGGSSQKHSRKDLFTQQQHTQSFNANINGKVFGQSLAQRTGASSQSNKHVQPIKTTAYRMNQADAMIQQHQSVRGKHSSNNSGCSQGGQVDIQKLILKNKAMENAIQMQNLQMQYIEQMQNIHNQQFQQVQIFTNQQQQGRQNTFLLNNRVSQQHSEQISRQSLNGGNTSLGGGNKNSSGRTLNSIQSKSTHHGGSNTANSNTGSNTNSNGEKSVGKSPAGTTIASMSQNFETGVSKVLNQQDVHQTAEGGQAEIYLGGSLGVPRALLQTTTSPSNNQVQLSSSNQVSNGGQSAFACYQSQPTAMSVVPCQPQVNPKVHTQQS